MSEQRKTARAGELLCADSGEYSDYGVDGFFVVLREFEPAAELAAYLAENPKQTASYSFSESAFLGSLIGKGLLMAVDYSTLYLGAYGTADSVSFRPFAV